MERKRLRTVRGSDVNVVREFAVQPHTKGWVRRGTKGERQHVTRGGNATGGVSVQQHRDLDVGGVGVGGSCIRIFESTVHNNVVDAIVFNLIGQIHRVGIVLRDAH